MFSVLFKGRQSVVNIFYFRYRSYHPCSVTFDSKRTSQ